VVVSAVARLSVAEVMEDLVALVEALEDLVALVEALEDSVVVLLELSGAKVSAVPLILQVWKNYNIISKKKIGLVFEKVMNIFI
jgi:hypothetical protein